MNPMQLLGMLRQGYSPKDLVMQQLSGDMGTSPMGKNLLDLAQRGDYSSLEQIARNIVQGQGKDFDQEFNAFKRQLGL